MEENDKYNQHVSDSQMLDGSLSPDQAIQHLTEFILDDETADAIYTFFQIKQTRHPDGDYNYEDFNSENSNSEGLNEDQQSMTDSQLTYPNESSENVDNSDEENLPYNTYEERQRVALEKLRFRDCNFENTGKFKIPK